MKPNIYTNADTLTATKKIPENIKKKELRIVQKGKNKDKDKRKDKERWTRGYLIEELYLCLISHEFKDKEGIIRRKYEEQVRKKMYWMALPPHCAVIEVHLKDLDIKIKQELLEDDPIMRDFTLKEAIGMICERIDNRYYLLSARRFLEVRLVP